MASLVSEAPFTYYGWRAREWLAKRGALPRPAERAPLPGGERALSTRDALRARTLVQADLGPLATREIDRLAARAAGLDDAVAVATLYREAGAYDRAQQLAVKRFADALPKGPSPGQEALWMAAWPRAFAESVQQATAGLSRLRPALVWALMREESSFRPAVRSSAGAVGLMQLMPATAARVAGEVGLRGFDEDRLTDPGTNIRLGTAYLDGLLGRFAGRASAAIGSYNAGPEPVARWLGERGGLADDEWVETIPYEETRNYVKRVQRSLQVYRELYADAR
jgi:soluble lytic murein transglycosylase